ncbi:hypothetical protein T484DRAFT_1773017, partial [Baffinella frigidus]
VCNHPDLFEERPIVSPLEIPPIDIRTSVSFLQVTNHREDLGYDYDDEDQAGAGEHVRSATLRSLNFVRASNDARSATLRSLNFVLAEAEASAQRDSAASAIRPPTRKLIEEMTGEPGSPAPKGKHGPAVKVEVGADGGGAASIDGGEGGGEGGGA